MTKRTIIKIKENLCNGCGACIPNCPEGALQIIDGKARLLSDIFCDGLGACIGHCPQGAITTEERETEPYDERKVMDNIIKAGEPTILAHLTHLDDHNEHTYLKQALQILKDKKITITYPEKQQHHPKQSSCHCPGAQMRVLQKHTTQNESGERESHLRQWPVQLHLVPPTAPYFREQNVLLVADCVAYALADFHKKYLKENSIAIACPKLDNNQEIYIHKIKALLDEANINKLSVMIMEVPCCGGLVTLVKQAMKQTVRKLPIHVIVVGIEGKNLKEEIVKVN